MDSLSFMKMKNKELTQPFGFFLSSQSFSYQNIPKSFLDMLLMRKRQKCADLLLEVLCARTKDTKQK